MKQFSKKISKFLLLGSIFVTLSCEVQENFNESNKRQILVEDFSLQSIQGKTSSKLLETANKIKNLNATAAHSKTVYNADFDFYMDDEHGIHMVIDGQDSYTFEIMRTTGDQKVENIIFNEKVDGSFETLLIKYDYSKEEFNSLPYQEILNKNKTGTVINTDNGTVSSTSRLCTFVLEDEPIPAYGANGYLKMTFVYVCPEDESGGGDGPKGQTGWGGNGADTGPSNGNGNTGNGYNNSNPTGSNPQGGGNGVTTTPVVVANPCKKIQKQREKFSSLTPALVTLASTTGQNYENGIFIDNSATAATPAPVQTVPANSTTGGTINLNMNPANPYTVIAHTHDASGSDGLGTFSIFSFADLVCIAKLIRENHIDTDNFVFYVATADNTKYAMTIEWPTTFAAYFDLSKDPNNPSNTNYYDSKKSQILEELNDKYYDEKKGLIKKNSNSVSDKLNFLKLMAEMDNLVTVFEVNADFTTHTKLKLNSNQTAVVPTPCSN